MSETTIENTGVRRGIYIPTELDKEMIEYLESHRPRWGGRILVSGFITDAIARHLDALKAEEEAAA